MTLVSKHYPKVTHCIVERHLATEAEETEHLERLYPHLAVAERRPLGVLLRETTRPTRLQFRPRFSAQWVQYPRDPGATYKSAVSVGQD